MIDRKARDQLQMVLQRLMTGTLTNDRYYDLAPTAFDDPAIRGIEAGVRELWSDHEEVTVALTKSDTELLDRVFLFLRTNQEFRWEEPNSGESIKWAVTPYILAAGVLAIVASMVASALGFIPKGPDSFLYGLAGLVIFLLLAKWLPPPHARYASLEYRARGDWDVWPFIDRASYEEALRSQQRNGNPSIT